MSIRNSISASRPQRQRERVTELQAEKEFCSTREAADLLGLAPGTVQKMVENGTLDAWRTEGGHRRILVASLAKLMEGHSGKATPTVPVVGELVLDILVVGETKAMTSTLVQRISEWGFPVSAREANNAIEAGAMLGGRQPHIAIFSEKLPDYDAQTFFEHATCLDGAKECDFVFVTADQHTLSKQLLANGQIAAAFVWPEPFADLRAFAQARFGQLIRETRRRAMGSTVN